MVKTQKVATAERGFTLVELMVVIVIAAILLTIAVPSFQSLIKRNNVDSLQSKLSSAMATARTEAASRNKVITICGSNDEATCTGAHWASGWVIFEDNNGNGTVDATDTVVDVYDNSTDYTVAATPTASTTISFSSQGFITNGGVATLLTICEPENAEAYARGLFVNASGLVMKTRDSDNSGVHDNPVTAGADLICL